jgi:hypothetical protein
MIEFLKTIRTMYPITQKNSIKTLLELPRGRPLTAETLRIIGIASDTASRYVDRGYLTRLGQRGFFILPNDELSASETIAVLRQTVPGLHVGGKTALAWRNIRHNIPAGQEVLTLWGGRGHKLPSWFSEKFLFTYTTNKIFSDDLPENFAISTLPAAPTGALVSCRERALLEMLDGVGTIQGTEEAQNIMEWLRTIRVDVLRTLLSHCIRIKVVRLCAQWAVDLRLDWANDVIEFANKCGRGRWCGKLPEGTTLILNSHPKRKDADHRLP